MPRNVAIAVENLSKAYRIGLKEEVPDTLVGAMQSWVKAPWRNFRRLRGLNTFRIAAESNGHAKPSGVKNQELAPTGPSDDIIWALRDVSFEVKEGEVIGIIGRNGAGKSTLLKVLSRITEPTSGRAVIRGRVGSLLEVGTGFHPELTGRENIYMNGTILGMTKREIDRKFDEIVDFSGVETFLDTPIKRYSSGMQVRLAFAVAAHLEPEILIVDEVLAVGDAGFQQKCLGTMQKVASSGRTVLFVSHNLSSIQQLCSRAVYLHGGGVRMDGSTHEAVQQYLSSRPRSPSVPLGDWQDRVTNGQARISRLEICDAAGSPTTSIPAGGTVTFKIEAEFLDSLINPCFGVLIHTAAGEPLLDVRSTHNEFLAGKVVGHIAVRAVVRDLWLYPGDYSLSPWITHANGRCDVDWVSHCVTLRIEPHPSMGNGLRLDPTFGRYFVPSDWSDATGARAAVGSEARSEAP